MPSNTVQRHSQPPSKKRFYKVSAHKSSQSQYTQFSPEKQIHDIMQRKHMLYIDVNEEGADVIKQVEKAQLHEVEGLEMERISNRNFVSNLSNLGAQSQKIIDYACKLREFRRQKDNFMRLLAQKDRNVELIKARKNKKKKNKKLTMQKIKEFNSQEKHQARATVNYDLKLEMPTLDREALSSKGNQFDVAYRAIKKDIKTFQSEDWHEPYIHGGIPLQLLKQYFEHKSLQKLQRSIYERENKLLQKVGYLDEIQKSRRLNRRNTQKSCQRRGMKTQESHYRHNSMHKSKIFRTLQFP